MNMSLNCNSHGFFSKIGKYTEIQILQVGFTHAMSQNISMSKISLTEDSVWPYTWVQNNVC